MPTALAAVSAVFPGSRLTRSTLKKGVTVAEATEVPENAERNAVLEAFRQAYSLVNAQRRFIGAAVEPALDGALSAIATAAQTVKENA